MRVLLLLSSFLANTLLGLLVDFTRAHEDHGGAQGAANFRWASGSSSNGGGWPAMVANMAMANVFQQAGVISNSSSSSSSSSSLSPHFSAISTASGGTWFATQFFYAQPFFEKTALATSPSDLSQFVLDWMNAYQSFTDRRLTNPQNANCNEVLGNITVHDDIPVFGILQDVCLVLLDYNGDWAAFINDMLNAVATDAMGQVAFSSRAVNAQMRIPSMAETDLYLQTSVVPNSRIRNTAEEDDTAEDQVIYIGPEREFLRNEIYSIPLAVQWSVASGELGNAYYYANTPSTGSAAFPSGTRTHERSKSQTFGWLDWQRFGMFPAENTDTQIQTPINSTLTGALQVPFGGADPTIGQIAGASSAAAGFLSGLTPSVLMQAASTHRYEILQRNLTEVEKRQPLGALTDAINTLYTSPVVDNVAVCSQWPNPCSDADARMVDGYVTDPLTAALNVGQYQSKHAGNDHDYLNQTMKLVITDTGNDSPHAFLSYFDTSFNQGVEPADFFWPKNPTDDNSPGSAALFVLPLFSPQIFADYLDMDMLNSQSTRLGVDGVDDDDNTASVETFTIQTTTIDNPAYNTVAGQPVEILYIRLQRVIPADDSRKAMIIGLNAIEASKGALAAMATSIASSTELVNTVQTFFFPPTPAPAPGPTNGDGGASAPTDGTDGSRNGPVNDVPAPSSSATASTGRVGAAILMVLAFALLLLGN